MTPTSLRNRRNRNRDARQTNPIHLSTSGPWCLGDMPYYCGADRTGETRHTFAAKLASCRACREQRKAFIEKRCQKVIAKGPEKCRCGKRAHFEWLLGEKVRIYTCAGCVPGGA